MKDDVLIKLRKAAVQSELIQVVSSLRRDNGKSLVLGDTPLRPLYREEIARLEGQGGGKRHSACAGAWEGAAKASH